MKIQWWEIAVVVLIFVSGYVAYRYENRSSRPRRFWTESGGEVLQEFWTTNNEVGLVTWKTNYIPGQGIVYIPVVITQKAW